MLIENLGVYIKRGEYRSLGVRAVRAYRGVSREKAYRVQEEIVLTILTLKSLFNGGERGSLEG